MMKTILKIFSFITILTSCNQNADNTAELKTKIGNLEKQINESYKPGFGEFMSGIQIHHNKLWFAGQNENWKLAEFEINEIVEAIDDIKRFQSERKETQSIDMLNPVIVDIRTAIQVKDKSKFISSYNLLTITCNNCHKQNDFEFNVIITPETPAFSNQSFSTTQRK